MKYNVIFSRRSDKMLLSHTEFLARISPAAARKMLAEFNKLAARLAENPLLFPFADELDAQGIPPEMYRKAFFSNRYKALFTVQDSTVYGVRY